MQPASRPPLPRDARRLVGKYLTSLGLVWRVNHYDAPRDRLGLVSLSTGDKHFVNFDDLRAGYDDGSVNFGREPRRA